MSNFGTEEKEAELCELSGGSSWQMKACLLFPALGKVSDTDHNPYAIVANCGSAVFPSGSYVAFGVSKTKELPKHPLFSFFCRAWLPQWPCTVYRIKFSALAYLVQSRRFKPPWCNRLITARIAYSVKASRGGLCGHPPVVSRDKPRLWKNCWVESGWVGSGRVGYMWP